MNAGFLRPAQLVVHIEVRRDESQMIGKFWVLKEKKSRRCQHMQDWGHTQSTFGVGCEGHCFKVLSMVLVENDPRETQG